MCGLQWQDFPCLSKGRILKYSALRYPSEILAITDPLSTLKLRTFCTYGMLYRMLWAFGVTWVLVCCLGAGWWWRWLFLRRGCFVCVDSFSDVVVVGWYSALRYHSEILAPSDPLSTLKMGRWLEIDGWLVCWSAVRRLVDLAVCFGWGLFGYLSADSLFVGWVDVGVWLLNV